MGTSNVKSPAGEAIIVFHIAYPLCLLLYFLVGYGIGVSKLQRTADVDGPKRNQSTLIRALLGFILLSYAVEAIAGFVQDLRSSTAKTPWDHNTYIFFSILFWGLQILVLRGYELSIRHPFLATWGVAFVTESALAILALVDHPLTDPTAYARFSLQAVRILALGLVITLPLLVWRRQRPRVLDEESSPLLGGNNGIQDTDFSDRYIEHDASQPVGYGTVEPQQATNGHAGLAQGSATSEDVEGGTKAQDKTSEGGKSKGPGSWLEFANRFKVLLPHLKLSMQSWPNLFGIGTCILAGRFLSVLVPRQLGIVTDALVAKNDSAAWLEVSFYLLYRFLESSSIIEDIRQACWDPISMGTKERVDVAALDHALHLSADYHENKRTGQLFKAVGQGSNVTALLEFSLFGLGPLLLDMVIAVGYLYILFGPYMGLIAAIMAVTYFLASSRLGSALDDKWKKYLDRCETTWDTVFGAIAQWYTISIFNRADYETQRYREALEAQRVAKLEHRWSARWVGAVQSLALTGGLCAACYLAVYQVLQGSQPLGNFVILLSYWSRASSSFEAVGSRIRSIMDHIIDIEHLLNLLETEPTVQEKEDAEQLRLRDGGVRFEDVCFAHDSRQSIIKHMSFEAKAGSKVAIVGSTGAGKSTVLKLLLRVRDVGQGSIKIDGQDIRDVTIQSLRDQVAVVPQNPTLFNESIMYNVRYGRLDATDDDVFDACKSAAIHEKVVSFPDGYNTKVGELAAKLSGGELQRLSIARAILKNPKILVLDEATSMIDSLTERRMQESLDELSKGRTCFVVAHRLSTIANADMILVVERGKIVEQGRHEELAGNHGPFYKFWSTQSVSSRSGSVAESKKSDGERVVVERVDKAVQSPDIHPSAHIVTVDRAVQTVDTHHEVQASNESTAEREASGAVRPLIEKVDRAIQSAETHHEARGSNKATTGQKSSGAVHSSIEKVDRAVQSVDTNDEARGSNKATTEQESSAAVGPLIEKVDRAVQSMNTHGEAKTSNGSTTDRESPGGTRPLIEKVDRGVQGMDTHDEAKMPNESTAVQEPSGDTRPSMEKVDEVVQSTDPHHEEMATKEPSTESRRSGGADAAPENVDNEMPRVDDPPDAVATNVPNAEATREEQDEGISNAKPETSNPETSNADTAAETSVEQELKADSKSRKTESKRNSQDVAWNPGAPDFVPKNQARPGSTPYRATLHDLQSNGISGEFYRYATFIQPSKAEALPHQTNLGAAAPADKQDEASPSTTPATQTDLGAATPANEQDEASPSAAPDMQKAAATRAPETGTESPNPLSSSSDKGNREGSEKKARKKKKKRQRHRGRKARPAQKSSEESTSSSNVPGLVQDKGASLADHHEPRESHPGQEAVEATHNGDNASGTRKGKKVRFHGDEHDGSADVEEAGGSYGVPVPKVFFRPPSPKPDDHAQSTSAGGKTPSAHSARPTPIARFRSRRWRFRKPGGHKPGGHKRGGSDNPVASGSGPANGSDNTF